MLLTVRSGSSTRSVVMMFWYPLPDTSRSSGFLEVPAASSADGCGAPASRHAFGNKIQEFIVGALNVSPLPRWQPRVFPLPILLVGFLGRHF
jgi:hypothetical protein